MLQGEHSAILSTFIKLPLVIKTFVLSIFEWLFYTGFTVVLCTLGNFLRCCYLLKFFKLLKTYLGQWRGWTGGYPIPSSLPLSPQFPPPSPPLPSPFSPTSLPLLPQFPPPIRFFPPPDKILFLFKN